MSLKTGSRVACFTYVQVQQTALLRNLGERNLKNYIGPFRWHNDIASLPCSLHTTHSELRVGISCTTVRDRLPRKNAIATEILQQGERANRVALERGVSEKPARAHGNTVDLHGNTNAKITW